MKSVCRRMDCRIVSVALSFGFLLVLFFVLHNASEPLIRGDGIQRSHTLDGNLTVGVRKLLKSVEEEALNRSGEVCSRDDIAIYQGPTTPLPNGIPTYTVQVLNVCVSGRSIANIHVSCGWFSSARMINPNIFRRVFYDDCLVNNGEALGPGQAISFQYANSFNYPLSVSSVTCL